LWVWAFGSNSIIFSNTDMERIPPDWTCYDDAAGSHDRLAVPVMFAPPARDLVARMGVGSARAILDVGTGPRIPRSPPPPPAPPDGLLLGVDLSLAMLFRARNHGIRNAAVGAIPGLPFADARFDRVMAAFVLSHVGPREAAIDDMMRVLQPGGRIGITAWGPK